jgi:hypothetical protein
MIRYGVHSYGGHFSKDFEADIWQANVECDLLLGLLEVRL